MIAVADARVGRRVGVLVAALTVICLAGIWLTSPTLRLLASGAAGVLLLRLVEQTLRHRRLALRLRSGSMPGTHAGVGLRWRPFRSGAAVAGLRRPVIYCDPRLEDDLTDRELSAVVLHERCHQLRRDTLRLLSLAAVEPLVSLTAVGRAWTQRQRAALEIRADRFALRHGADRADLAGAVLKLGDAAPAGTAAGFASAVELRLQALVDPYEEELPTGTGLQPWYLLAAVAGVCAVAIVHHLLALGGGVGCVLAGC